MAAAAAEGELATVEWLHRHGCPMGTRVLMVHDIIFRRA
eukprot:COSAG01_NODE_33745_length_559_cov_1.195652_1_plen_38_part_10